MVAAHPDLTLVGVEKKRFGFSVNGIICEFAYVWMNGAQLETACCESEDYDVMQAAVRSLGLADKPNVNYLKAAKQVVGF